MSRIIDFYADWCMPCKIVDPILKELEKELNITVERVNVDENMDMANQYGAMSIPTLVIEKDGKEITRLVGAKSKAEYKEAITESV